MRIDLVLVKLAAVFIFVYALKDIAYYVTYLEGSANYALAAFVFCLIFVFPAAIAWALWRFPATSVGALYRDQGESSPADYTADDVFLIGISLFGVYVLVFGIIDLAYYEAHRYAEYQIAKGSNYPFRALPSTVGGRVMNIVQILVGIVLIVGRRGITRFVYGLRTAGTKTR